MAAPHLPLPGINAKPVSAETRLAYVLRHFRQAYEQVPDISIGYKTAQPQIEIADGADDFFQQRHPYPPAPTQREWLGRHLPFFFDPAPDEPLLTFKPGRVCIAADIVSAAFYLLSGWQEYFSAERDRHGRFPYAASVQHRYGFVTVPVVNYYFDVLRTAVEHVTGQPLRPRRWQDDAPFAAFVTHDIDNLRSAWKAPAKTALQQRQWLRFGRLLWQHFTAPDAWDNLEDVQRQVAQYGAASTFFFLPNHLHAPDGPRNADYQFHRMQQRVQALAAQSEIGLHGSLGTARNAEQLYNEAQRVSEASGGTPHELGLRFHYLSWEPRITPSHLDELAIPYDTTLGFAEHFGFRNGYCRPFQLFNFETGEAYNFLEIPLNLMDTTLHHPSYLQLRPPEILPAVQPMLAEIERFGGLCTMLWHNENFDPANERNGPRQFHELMAYLRNRQAAFLTGRQIFKGLRAGG